MAENNFFLLNSSTKRKGTGARHYGLVGCGMIIVAGLVGLFLPALAQPADPAEGTPVSTNYQGLRTTRAYQPVPINVGASTTRSVCTICNMPS